MDCKQATFLVSKRQETELSFKEKLSLKLHLAACKLCALFEKETTFLCNNIDQLHKHDSTKFKMDDNAKKSISEKLKREYSAE